MIDRTNPIPYEAHYFGHKIHLDQNEKLAMFGTTHVIAVDGYSGKIVGHTTMPVKNNLLIYRDVYRYDEITIIIIVSVNCASALIISILSILM